MQHGNVTTSSTRQARSGRQGPSDVFPGSGSASQPPGLALAAFLIGFASSGFFDGILLHQTLQWHHLLSAVDGDLRWQMAADGWFHVGMYAVAAIELWRLWLVRAGLPTPGASRTVAAWGLIGFGAWHVVDAFASHWILAIHRIRMDAANPLAWDIGWLAVFGLVPLGLGWWLRTGRGGPGSAGPPRRATGEASGGRVAMSLAAVSIVAGLVSTRPPPGYAHTVIAFAPWVSEGEALRVALGTGGSLVWNDGAGVAVVADVPTSATLPLYLRGALFVGGGPAPLGCLAWRG